MCLCLAGCATLGRGERVDAGDTRLYLDVKGRKSGGAVILFLHGGPGSGISSLLSFRAYPGPLLEERHLVAYLHQRGVMKSPAVPLTTQTLATHTRDVDRVVQHLRRRYPDRPLVLVGHSWGGVLALNYAARHPQARIDGMVLVGTPVCMPCNEKASYAIALEWARRTGRGQLQHVLEAMGTPPYATLGQMMQQRRLTRRAIPRSHDPASLAKMLDVAGYDNINPAWTLAEVRIAHAMYPELMTTDLRPDLPALRWPLLVFAGALDGTVMAEETVTALEQYAGPKRVVTFDTGDHQLFVQDPRRFTDELNAFIAGMSMGMALGMNEAPPP
jgi:pimeloyl-ACP methyl ester carboxylesterase